MTQQAHFVLMPFAVVFPKSDVAGTILDVFEDATGSAWRQCQDAPTEHMLVHKKSLLPLFKHTSA